MASPLGYHPRVSVVQRAKADLDMQLIAWQQKHHLTVGEVISIHLEEAAWWSEYVVRAERHGPNSARKSCEAADES